MTMIELGKITEIRTGRLNANQAIEGGKYPFFTCSVNPLRIDDYAYDCECVLVAGNGDLNVKYYNGKFNVYQRVYIVESIDKSKYDVKFLYYFLQTHIDTLRRNSIGGVIKYIRLGDLTNAEVPNFTIETQRKIVSVIEKSEKTLVLRKQQTEALSALKQSVFLDMFGDPTSNPKRYVKKQLKEIGEITTGNTPPRKDKDNYGDYVEWIKTNNINENSIYLSQAIEYLSEKGASIGRVVSENSILVTCIAGSRSSIGRAAIANRRVAFNQQINAISPSEIINTSFLYTQIKILKPYIQSFSTNSMKGMISKTNFEKIEVIVPTLEVQAEFHHKFKQINSIEKKMKNSLICLEEMYDSLLQKAFNGELLKEEIKA